GLRLRWGTIALAAVCFSIGPLHDVPPFSMFRGPVCWVSILHLPLALHTGWGFDQVVSGSRRAGLVALVAAVSILPLLALRAALWLVMAALTLLLLRGRERMPGVCVLLFTIVGCIFSWVPVGAPAGTLHRFAPGQPVYPRPDRLADVGAALRRACDATSGGR